MTLEQTAAPTSPPDEITPRPSQTPVHDLMSELLAAVRTDAPRPTRRRLATPASIVAGFDWLTTVLWARLGSPTPVVKQSSATLLFALAVVVALVERTLLKSDGTFVAACVAILIATALSIVFTARPSWMRFELVLIGADFLALELLRTSTGASLSPFGSLVIVPLIWTARRAGRHNILFASVGVAAVFFIPLIPVAARLANPAGFPAACFALLVFGVAATIVNQLSEQAQQQLDAVEARETAIGQELDRGAEVQQALLPKGASPVAGYEVAGRCIPAKVVGGDFYDWYPIPDGLGFTLGDVMGKGVGAGMIAATAHAVVRSARFDADPVSALLRADAVLSTELIDVGSFTTMFHARLHAEDGLVQYADAGHGLTLLVRADGTWRRLSATDLPLGLDVNARWETRELTLDPGDMLVSFSDGVLELYDGTLAATDQVGALAASCTTAAQLVEAVAGMAVQTANPDDVTVLVVRREPTA